MSVREQHTGHLFISGQKMSKSLKNFTSIQELLKDHSGEAFRMFILQHKYSAGINYSEDRIHDAEVTLSKFKR